MQTEKVALIAQELSKFFHTTPDIFATSVEFIWLKGGK